MSMKSADEIKKGLECCIASTCLTENGCPYRLSRHCGTGLKADALALIQQLEKRAIHLEALNQSNLTTITMQERTRARLQERISQLEAERDAAVADILYAASVYLGECNTCKNGEVCAACKKQDACDECPNSKCMCSGCGAGRSNWQWRGVQKEE